MAARTPTIRMLSNEGGDMLFEAKATVNSTDTMAINTGSASHIVSTDTVKIVSATDIDKGTILTGIKYTTAGTKFDMNSDSGISSRDEVRVEFRVKNPQAS